MLKNIKKQTAAVTAATAGLVVSTQSYASDSWDFAGLTSGISFSGVATGVLAVAALLATVYAGVKGAKIVLGFLRS